MRQALSFFVCGGTRGGADMSLEKFLKISLHYFFFKGNGKDFFCEF